MGVKMILWGIDIEREGEGMSFITVVVSFKAKGLRQKDKGKRIKVKG